MYFPKKKSTDPKSVDKILNISPEQMRNIEKELLEFPTSRFCKLSDIYPDTNIFVSPIQDEFGSFMGMLFLFNNKRNIIPIENSIQKGSTIIEMEYKIDEIIHEVKNPLGIILNFLGLIKSESQLESVHSYGLNIEKEVERISRLLDTLKHRNDTNKNHAQHYTKMSGLIDGVSALLKPAIIGKNIEIKSEYFHDSLVEYDSDLLNQVTLNIMLNAVEAMDDQGTLTIICDEIVIDNHKYHSFSFCDTGPGIEPENINRIFEPFFTTKENEESSGIGLSICKEIIESFNGSITVTRTSEKGTVFRILLPVQ